MRRGRGVPVAIALAAVCPLLGCASVFEMGPYTPRSEASRNPLEAQRLTLLAVSVAESDPARAEALLREALTADLWHGPAHNNLGVVFMGQGKLYEAANEFEWAKKLLPGDPDPRFNLALTLERARRFDDALSDYHDTLDQHPHHMPTKQALVRLQRWLGKADRETPMLLKEIALEGESEVWRDWAAKQLVALRD